MRSVTTRTGAELPVLGQGTWRMGESPGNYPDEIAALRLGIDLGMTLIDTAEMYADGGAEEVVGEAMRGRRSEVYVVSKVLPHNASRQGTVEAAERSLGRLRTDRIDLYLLHWPGSHPLDETYEGFERLREQGKILDYGVSNFDVGQMEESEATPHGDRVAVNQVLYNLGRRGIERRLLPWCTGRNVPIMAYSPFDQGRLPDSPVLRRIADRYGASPRQVALAWVLRWEGVVAIPKSSSEDHVLDNSRARYIELSGRDLAEIDLAFPVPDRDVPLETA